jgi:putative endonuclease
MTLSLGWLRGLPTNVIPAKAGTSVWDGGMGKSYWVYILASRKYGALYVGVTGDLIARLYVHREELVAGQTSRHHIHNLVYFEIHGDPESAILREKRIKKWRRAWKIDLIEKDNPDWRDLYPEIVN